jgi:hypothetical protein
MTSKLVIMLVAGISPANTGEPGYFAYSARLSHKVPVIEMPG